MEVYGVVIPIDKGLTNFDIFKLVDTLQVPNFRGVFMRDELPKKIKNLECGVMNLNTHKQSGSHWVCYMRNYNIRIYSTLLVR